MLGVRAELRSFSLFNAPTYGRSVGSSLVRTWNLIIRVSCALVVGRISGTRIR